MNRTAETNQHRTSVKAAASKPRISGKLSIALALLCGLFVLVGLTISPLRTVSSASSKSSGFEARKLNGLFLPTDGTITIKTSNYNGPSTTETATFTKQVFSSTDCSTGGGSVDTVTGVNSITGYSFTLGSGSSVQLTIPDSGIYFPHVSEQNGPFAGMRAADNSYQSSMTAVGDGHQVCIQGFDGPGTRLYLAQF